MGEKIIRWNQLKVKLGGDEAPTNVSIWRWERDGIFPKRIKIGPNAVGWLESEIDAFISQRAAERDRQCEV